MSSCFRQAAAFHEKAVSNAITADDLDAIIAWPAAELSVLFAAADQVRRHFFGNTVDPCALMNVKSGGCTEDCAFCAQSAHSHAHVNVTVLASAGAIAEQFAAARARGLSFCVVSSGRRLPREEVACIARAVATCGGGLHASLGILDDEDFRLLAKAGVACYNHNLETSRRFYPRIVTTHGYDERIETVKRARKAGIPVCCGGIFGLGESWEDRKQLCLELRGLDVHTIPLNFFIPIPCTRIEAPPEPALELLRIVAMFRLAHPDTTIKVCGGRELHLDKLQGLAFFAGANGYVSGGYLTTPGAGVDADDRMIAALGLVKAHPHA